MKRIFTASILLASSLIAGAQPREWTLAECIGHALENNITIQQSAINVESKEVAVSSAKNRRLPGVSGSASQNFSFGRGLTADNTYANANTTSTSFSLGADVPVFSGLQNVHNIALGKLDLEAATADLEKAKDDIRVAVAQAYVQILYDMEIVEVAESQVDIDQMQVERLSEMAANGKSSRAEVSAQEATLAQSQLSLTQARNNLSLALLELSQLLELPSPEGFAIARPNADGIDDMLLMSPEDIYAEAVQVKPAIKSEMVRLAYADRNIKLAKSGYIPTISLNGGIGTNYYTSSGYASANFGQQARNNFSQYLGLSLNVPIFDRLQTRNQIRSAKLQKQNQELQVESVKKSLYKEIQQAYYNAVGARGKYLSSKVAAKSAQDAFELATAKYETGKSGITEFNESKTRLMSAESDLAKARFEYLYQSKLLEFYRGNDLVL
ncbi:MAG: TolC family protein [Bacteroidales bacterium]|nr:TolC family protein [Candidatus Cryptobacteroides caccocaballi]